MTVSSLTVSIVLYKTPLRQLNNCIKSLENCKDILCLYFVDNSPTDYLKEKITTNLSYKYFHMPSNPGYGAGHNAAIRDSIQIKSKYHLVINADVYFNEDILTPMLDFMNKSPNVGQIMPKILNPDGTNQYLCKLLPSPLNLLLRILFKSKNIVKYNYFFEMRFSGYNKIMFVPYLSGCFMLLRQSALKKVGLFDERFFMYPEDIDLTRRLALSYDTIFYPFSSVYHEHAAQSKRSLKMFFIHCFNIYKYFNKWGWIIDRDRQRLNLKALSQFKDIFENE